jgi:hypothetical protein
MAVNMVKVRLQVVSTNQLSSPDSRRKKVTDKSAEK